jgi:hypothetical protein
MRRAKSTLWITTLKHCRFIEDVLYALSQSHRAGFPSQPYGFEWLSKPAPKGALGPAKSSNCNAD